MKYYDKDHECFTKKFEELVEKHGGEWIVIINGEVIGIAPKHKVLTLLKKARKKYPDKTPLVSPIPKEEEIECKI